MSNFCECECYHNGFDDAVDNFEEKEEIKAAVLELANAHHARMHSGNEWPSRATHCPDATCERLITLFR